MWGNVGYRHSTYFRFMNLIGYTYGEHNPDSWEGWHWGATHMWGFSHRLGIPEQYDLLEDALQNTEMVVFWSADPEATCSGVYAAFESTQRRFWLKELGVKMVFIDPYMNHTAGLYGGKWFSPSWARMSAWPWPSPSRGLPKGPTTRTTSPMHDRFRRMESLCPRESDGVPKTPEWAEAESGIAARDIRALAREWASKKTMLASGSNHGMGGACRASWGNEWARAMVALAAMQGMGKPGSNIWATTTGARWTATSCFQATQRAASPETWTTRPPVFAGSTDVPKGRSHAQSAPLHGRPDRAASADSRSDPSRAPGVERQRVLRFLHRVQFQKYEYPAPGYPNIGIYYRYGGSFFGTMTETNRYVKAYQTDKLPFVVNQSIWMEGEAKFADIILPACTNFERWISASSPTAQVYERQLHTVQPSGDRPAEEMYRAAG